MSKMANVKVTPADAGEALKFTAKVVDECGARLAGSDCCKKSAQIIAAEMRKFCSAVDMESFDVHPEAFLGFLKAAAVIYLASSVLLFFNYILPAAAGYLLIVVMATSQFIFYRELFDPFYRKTKGYNVVGSIEPAGDVKQQIIVSGHHDSAHEFRFLARHQRLYPLRIILAAATVMVTFVLSWLWAYRQFFIGMDPGFGPYLRYGVLAGLIFVAPMFFFISPKGTPGAGDNMIATAIAVKLAELFRKTQQTGGPLLKNTRLTIVSFDAEESGLRGSRAYVQRHQAALQAIPTCHFNIDSIYNLKELKFLTTDINGTVRLSAKMAAQCRDIAARLGYPVGIMPIPPGAGGTDAAEFAKAGVEAATLIGLSTNICREKLVYHTMNDTVDRIEPAAVEATLKIALEYILKKDQEVPR